LLLAPGLRDGEREALLRTKGSSPNTAAIPVLTLSSTLNLALLDELSASAPWRSLFEELVGR
jgi:hypothetical protein